MPKREREMAQQVKVLTTKSDLPRFVPSLGLHGGRKRNEPLRLFFGFYMHAVMRVCLHT